MSLLIVGLTGGIGSGKSTVSDRFAELGVPVIDTDVIAREVVAPGTPTLRKVFMEFGEDVIGADGALDRAALGQRVFDDPRQRTRLEGIVHPAIRQEVLRRIARVKTPYCVVVVPLLVETDFIEIVDRVLVVDADSARRRRWVAERSGLSSSQIDRIFAAQASQAERLKVADDVIVNDGTKEALAAKVDDLHNAYLELATTP